MLKQDNNFFILVFEVWLAAVLNLILPTRVCTDPRGIVAAISDSVFNAGRVVNDCLPWIMDWNIRVTTGIRLICHFKGERPHNYIHHLHWEHPKLEVIISLETSSMLGLPETPGSCPTQTGEPVLLHFKPQCKQQWPSWEWATCGGDCPTLGWKICLPKVLPLFLNHRQEGSSC